MPPAAADPAAWHPDQRRRVRVACGVLQNARGEVLLAQRPAGKIAAGLWEFPGGKIEPGETSRQALARELDEELGVAVSAARPLIRFGYEYGDRNVWLETWLVTGFDGTPQPREAQQFTWLEPAATAAYPLLPTVTPIVRALRLPVHYPFTPADADIAFLLPRLSQLPHGALLRLRLPALDDKRYAALAAELVPHCRVHGLRLMLDRDPALAVRLGAAGWHASERAWRALSARPFGEELLFAASAHDADGLRQLEALGADCAVLGPVFDTATHPDAAGIGWPAFTAAADCTMLPCYAIGGTAPLQLPQAWQQAAQGIAAIRAYWPQ
jgi:8-oxo-dGTP diphosphatase